MQKQNSLNNNTNKRTNTELSSTLPSSNNLTSLSARTLSAFKFLSMALLRARAALSSALKVQPILEEGLDS